MNEIFFVLKPSFISDEPLVTLLIDMSTNPLDIYKEFDPKVIESFNGLQELVFSEGALAQKSKMLIAMAIDVEHGALQGAIALGRRAIKLGATKEEIVETLRVSYYIGGNRALFTSAQVLQNLFKQDMKP
jgi:alkylhydroperoxidase/carboxymuconolactone decarboxylase family protein YurZ